jgi:hypothetical protein
MRPRSRVRDAGLRRDRITPIRTNSGATQQLHDEGGAEVCPKHDSERRAPDRPAHRRQSSCPSARSPCCFAGSRSPQTRRGKPGPIAERVPEKAVQMRTAGTLRAAFHHVQPHSSRAIEPARPIHARVAFPPSRGWGNQTGIDVRGAGIPPGRFIPSNKSQVAGGALLIPANCRESVKRQSARVVGSTPRRTCAAGCARPVAQGDRTRPRGAWRPPCGLDRATWRLPC